MTFGSHVDLKNEVLVSPDFPGEIGDHLINFENVVLEGSANSMVTGNDKDNFISTGSGDDILNGGLGNDEIKGGEGSDEIDGGEGVDTATYEGDSSQYGISALPLDDGSEEIRIMDVTTGDVDTLKNIERIKFGDGKSINLINNSPTGTVKISGALRCGTLKAETLR